MAFCRALTGAFLVWVLVSPVSAMRAELDIVGDRIMGNATTRTAGDAIEGVFEKNNILWKAVHGNMFAITGSKNYDGGDSQEVSYRFDDSGACKGWGGFNEGLSIQAYFCKAACPDPDKNCNSPGRMSRDAIVAKGEDPASFEVAGLSQMGLKLLLNIDGGRLKPNKQPILAATSDLFTSYSGAGLNGDCYLIVAHNHEINYHHFGFGAYAALPTEVQILGTADLSWFQTEGLAPPEENSMCGVCMKISYTFGGAFSTKPIAKIKAAGPCKTKRSGNTFSRTV